MKQNKCLKIQDPKINALIKENINDDTHFQNLLIENIDLNGSVSEDIEKCHFINVNLNNSELNVQVINDTIFENCNLVNLLIPSLKRVIFKNCNLMGCQFMDTILSDVQVIDSKCDYINIANVHIKNMIFENSSLKAGRIYDCKLSNVSFNKGDLRKIEIYRTNFKGIDLSSCNVENINADLDSLKGLVIDASQALDIARLTGVIFK